MTFNALTYVCMLAVLLLWVAPIVILAIRIDRRGFIGMVRALNKLTDAGAKGVDAANALRIMLRLTSS